MSKPNGLVSVAGEKSCTNVHNRCRNWQNGFRISSEIQDLSTNQLYTSSLIVFDQLYTLTGEFCFSPSGGYYPWFCKLFSTRSIRAINPYSKKPNVVF